MHLVMTLLLQLQGPPATAPPAQPPPPVSLDRIRQGLESPPATVTVLASSPDLPLVFRLEIRERPLPYEHLWERDWVPSYIQPTRGLYHHEFLEQVTPDFFRSGMLYPCCPVLPLLNKLRKRGPDRQAETRARVEVKQALKAFLDQQKEQEKRQRAPEAK
jgi:hypothetical protein